MIPIWEVDANGNVIEHDLWTQEQIDAAKAGGRNIITFSYGAGFYTPKFDLANNGWVEGADVLPIKKGQKMDELNFACNQAILGLFTSVFNGTTYSFSCDEEAQTNFEKVDRAFEKNRITSIGWTAYDADGNVVRLTYDVNSFETLYTDHLNHIQGCISKLRDTLQPQVENSTLDTIDSIKWS